MTEILPRFRYHPDPVGTSVIKTSDAACLCCGRERGFIYTGPVYGENDLDARLCPWCIANGSAASKLGASFAPAPPGVPQQVIDEIELRTPSYVSWQSEEWLAHCNDACEFHGDASVEDIQNISAAAKKQILSDYGGDSDEDWETLTQGYTPGGDPAFYKFVCRHCGFVQMTWDCS